MNSEEQPDWLLERIHLGELPSHLAHRGHGLSADAQAQRRLTELEQDARDFASGDHRVELDEIRRVAASRSRTAEAVRRSSTRRAWGIGIPLAAMGLVLAAFPWQASNRVATMDHLSDSDKYIRTIASVEPMGGDVQSSRQQPTGSSKSSPATSSLDELAGSVSVAGNPPIRSKGEEISFLIHRKRQGSTTRLASGDTVVAGDMLQISVEAQRMEYLCIVSVDSIGTLTAHLPETPSRAVVVDSGMRMVLPHAYELDASPGYERFLLFWSHAPFETSRVINSIRMLSPEQRRQGIPELEGLQARALIFPKGRR